MSKTNTNTNAITVIYSSKNIFQSEYTMDNRPKRYDPCSAYQCTGSITHVLVYGCLNGHIQEAFGCLSHIEYYQSILHNYHCGTCNLQWGEEWLIEELWTATTS